MQQIAGTVNTTIFVQAGKTCSSRRCISQFASSHLTYYLTSRYSRLYMIVNR